MSEDDLVYLKERSTQPVMRLIMVDYDGTLVPIRDWPAQADPTIGLRSLLSAMCKVRRLRLAVISGRSLEDLQSMLPIRDLWMAGSHGAEILPGGKPQPVVLAGESLRDLFVRLTEDVKTAVGNIPGILVERKPFALAMHYRAADAESAAIARQRFRTAVLGSREGRLLRISRNKCVLEAIPRSVSKAAAVRYLLETFDLTPEESMYIGDDRTDEDAFEYLFPGGITVKVAEAPRPTVARFRLRRHVRVLALLHHILKQESLRDN